MTFPFSFTPRGAPLMDTNPATALPGYAEAFNAQSSALDTMVEGVKTELEDGLYVATIAELPALDNAPGEMKLVGENNLWYGWDGSAWQIVTGQLPYFSGDRTAAALGDTGGGNQPWVTGTTVTRGISLSGGVLTFAVEGIYQLIQSIDWLGVNTAGQRNLGSTTTGQLLGPLRSTMDAPTIYGISQEHTTHIKVAAGDTVTPYVAHNAGATLSIQGTISLIWIASAA